MSRFNLFCFLVIYPINIKYLYLNSNDYYCYRLNFHIIIKSLITTWLSNDTNSCNLHEKKINLDIALKNSEIKCLSLV